MLTQPTTGEKSYAILYVYIYVAQCQLCRILAGIYGQNMYIYLAPINYEAQTSPPYTIPCAANF